MVHTFSFTYKNNPMYFLYDIEGGSLHIIDKTAFLVCKHKYEIADMTEQDLADYELVSLEDKKEIEAELQQLVDKDLLEKQEQRYCINRNGEIKALCLHICHDCNLGCKYCFAHEGTYNTEKDYMSFEVGKAAIDFLISHSGNRHNLEADFFGGEPLMNLDVVKQIVEYAKAECKKAGKVINFTMTTNCVLLDKDTIDWLNKEMFNIVLSIDGRPEVHNRMRRTHNDKDTQALVLKNAKAMRAVRGDKSYYVRGTFTANNLDFAEDVLYLNDQGFDQISMEPVVADEKCDYAIREEHLPKILAEYDKLAEAYLDRRANGKWFNFFHFMIDLKNGPCVTKRLTGCGAGREYVAVSPVGDIYPCHQFVGGSEEYYMGNVLTGEFNRDIQSKFADIVVYDKEGCKDCFAKYYCSGGCCANSLNYAGSLLKPYKISCEMMRKRYELSLAIYAIEHLQDEE